MRFLPLTLLLLPLSAHAQIEVRFLEGAPKDTFVIKSSCQISAGTLSLDMSTSAGGLIFDVTSAGAGVEVFQPLEFVLGQEWVKEIPQVRDGDQTLTLRLKALEAGAEIIFTIDMDDTLGGREITVSGSEIAGGLVAWMSAGVMAEAEFSTKATAALGPNICE